MSSQHTMGERLVHRSRHALSERAEPPMGLTADGGPPHPGSGRAHHGHAHRAFAWFRWVDDIFSTYKRDSTISRLNRGEVTLSATHPDVRAVLARCEELRQETEGYFKTAYVGPATGPGDEGEWNPSTF